MKKNRGMFPIFLLWVLVVVCLIILSPGYIKLWSQFLGDLRGLPRIGPISPPRPPEKRAGEPVYLKMDWGRFTK